MSQAISNSKRKKQSRNRDKPKNQIGIAGGLRVGAARGTNARASIFKFDPGALTE